MTTSTTTTSTSLTDTGFNRFIEDFSGEYAEQYAVRRPAYPQALIDWLVAQSPANDHVWDAGCGAGELAAPLADRFATVTASDANADMLAAARRRPNLAYHEWASERPVLDPASCDLVTAGMAAHWFDEAAFYPTVERVLRPGGLLAVVAFYFFDIERGIGDMVRDWYERDMTGYEFPQLTTLRRHYADYSLPESAGLEPLELPQFTMTESWSFGQLAAFLRQWIVVKRARERGVDALSSLLADIAHAWPSRPEATVEVRWPLFGFAARRTA